MLSSGCNPKQSYLFVIDGSEALRHAIDSVFGNKNTVQRCCNHKIKNVLSYLPDELKDQVESSMKAAFRLEADKGMAKLEKLAQRLDKEHASVAASLREGLLGDVYCESPRVAQGASPLLMHDQYYRVAPLRYPPEDLAGDPLARW